MTILDSWNDLRPKSNIRCTLKMHSDLVTSLAAAIAQLGERQTEDLKVPGSIPGGGIKRNCSKLIFRFQVSVAQWITRPPPKWKIAGSSPARDDHGASLRCPQIQSNSDGEFWDRNPGSPQLKFFLHHF